MNNLPLLLTSFWKYLKPIFFSTAFQLGIHKDIGLILAGVLGVGMMIFKNSK